MNDMLVGILGLAVIAATVISLTRGKMLPAMAFILWPSVLALALTSPMTAALLLAMGMADVPIRNHIRASALYVWSFSFLCLMFAIFIGLVPF